MQFTPGDYTIIPVALSDKLADSFNIADQMYKQHADIFTGFRIMFTRKLWINDNTKPSDPTVSLLFHQVVETFLGGAIFTDLEMSKLFRDNICQIIALLLHIRRVSVDDKDRRRKFIP